MRIFLISILGLTAINYGYPILGEYGEEAMRVEIEYADGSRQEYILKNGVDVCIAYTSVGSSRINPVCENAKSFARFSYDKNFEEYVINRLDIKTKPKPVSKVLIKSVNPACSALIYGVYL